MDEGKYRVVGGILSPVERARILDAIEHGEPVIVPGGVSVELIQPDPLIALRAALAPFIADITGVAGPPTAAEREALLQAYRGHPWPPQQLDTIEPGDQIPPEATTNGSAFWRFLIPTLSEERAEELVRLASGRPHHDSQAIADEHAPDRV